MKPEDIIRKGEIVFKDHFKSKKFTDEEWLNILTENPELIERPNVVKDDLVVLGRPPENVKTILH